MAAEFSFTLPAEETPEVATAFASLNGIRLPIAIAGAQLEPVYGEDEARSFSGMARRVLRSDKREWTLELVPQTQLAARAFHGLINGKGHAWNFTDFGLYSSTGIAPNAGHTATVQTSGSGAHPATSYMRLPAGDSIRWYTGISTGPWTVLAWRKEGLAWVHYVYRSTGDGWADGVYTPAGIDAADFIEITPEGELEVRNGGVGNADYYDIALLPFLVPDDWAAQILAWDTDHPRAGLPRLHAEGPLFYTADADEDPVYVLGRVSSANLTPYAGARNAEQLSIRLREV